MYGTILKYLLPAVAGIALVVFVYYKGYGAASSEYQAKIAANTAAFERDARAQEAKNQIVTQQEKDALNNELSKQKQSNVNLTIALNGMRAKSNNYVTQIERLSKTSPTACYSALELANRQYNELADFAKQTAERADSAGAISNSLNAYANGLSR